MLQGGRASSGARRSNVECCEEEERLMLREGGRALSVVRRRSVECYEEGLQSQLLHASKHFVYSDL